MPKDAFKEHLLLLKSQGVASLSIPAHHGKRLREVLQKSAGTAASNSTPTPLPPPAKAREGDYDAGLRPAAPISSSEAGPRANPASQTLSRERSSPVEGLDAKSLTACEPSASFDMPKKSSASKISVAAIPALALPAAIAKKDKQAQWDWLKDHVLNDPTVKSHVREGVQPVFGVGNINSPIFFCGEAPGAEEEQQGEPFVGRAGQLLTKIISAMGFERKDIYIANILNWRPEKENMDAGNRPPTLQEMSKCIPFLKAQVNIVKPQVIVALGATATTGLLGEDPDRKMGDVRGKFHEFNGTPVMVTYHPSYLLRNNTNAAKRVVWEDLLLVMKKVGMKITPAQEKFFT